MKTRKWLAGGAVAALGLAPSGFAPMPASGLGGELEVVFFDAGDGDAAVVLTPGPDRKVLVIDGGYQETAAAAMAPYLEAAGVAAIDLMILTHPGRGHVEGLRELVQRFEVREVWDPGPIEPSSADYQAFAADALAEARTRYYQGLGDQLVEVPAADVAGDEHRRIALGAPLPFGTAEIVVLHAAENPPAAEADAAKAASLVVKVVYGENAVLFTGDARGRRERQPASDSRAHSTERALLELESRLPGVLGSTVLKVPDHGHELSSSQQFLDAVRPRWAVLSCAGGAGGADPAALARYAKARINLVRTDAGDTHEQPHDDHVHLRLGAREGDLVCRQVDTASLLQLAGDVGRPAAPALEPSRVLVRPRPPRGR